MSWNRDRADLNVNVLVKMGTFSERGWWGGVKEQAVRGCWPLLLQPFVHVFQTEELHSWLASLVCVPIFMSVLMKKAPGLVNAAWLVINKSVKWQERFLYASFGLWNVATMRFQMCVCVCMCVYKPRAKWDNNTLTPRGKVIKL